jgi:hypothetical protein
MVEEEPNADAGELQRLRAEVRRLRAYVRSHRCARLGDALLGTCVECGAYDEDRHRDDCERALVLGLNVPKKRDLTVVCVSCSTLIHQGTDPGPTSHGMCEACEARAVGSAPRPVVRKKET